jgi:circadian clock protein KaiB
MVAGKKNSSVPKYHFTVYIDSQKPKSAYAVERLRRVCAHYLIDSYTLDVVDLQKNPLLFEEKRVYAVPTLDVTTSRKKKHRFVGDLSHTQMFIMAIGMRQAAIKMGRESIAMKENAIRMCDEFKKT